MTSARFSSFARTPRALLLLALAAGLLAAASPARAGFGDLAKKAKEKAAQAAAGKLGGKAPAASGSAAEDVVEFTDDVLELNPARIDQVLKGLRAGGDVLAGRAALVTRRDQLQNEAGKIADQYGTAMDAARQKRDKVESCWRDVLHDRSEAREAEMQKKMMSDPAMREKLMELGLEMADAQARGDSAGVAAAQRKLEAFAGATHADTVAATTQCGALPPLHPMDVKLSGLQKQAADVDDQIRRNDQKSVAAQVEASGLTEAQFAMARERLLMWYSAVRAKQNPRGFTPSERSALDARRGDLEPALAPWAD